MLDTGTPGKTSPSTSERPAPSAPRIASAVSPPQPSSVPTPPAVTRCAIPSANRAPAARGVEWPPLGRDEPDEQRRVARRRRPGRPRPAPPSTVTTSRAARRSTWARVIGSCDPIASRIGRAAVAATADRPAPEHSRRAAPRPDRPRRPAASAARRSASRAPRRNPRRCGCPGPRGRGRSAASAAATSIGASTPGAGQAATCDDPALRRDRRGDQSARRCPPRAARTATSSATWPLSRESTFLNDDRGQRRRRRRAPRRPRPGRPPRRPRARPC